MFGPRIIITDVCFYIAVLIVMQLVVIILNQNIMLSFQLMECGHIHCNVMGSF
jgi:hypothetical protein